jgi:hypothetical protein
VSIKSRLAYLERATTAQRSRNEELEQRAVEQRAKREAAWAIMQQSMNAEHARLVVEAYAAGAQRVESSDFNTPGGRLLRHCLDAMSRLEHRHWPETDIAAEVILAMPPDVAQVYLTEGAAIPLHDCEECGFRVPITPGEYQGKPAQRHFVACPLCGGRTGYAAYFTRRKARQTWEARGVRHRTSELG